MNFMHNNVRRRTLLAESSSKSYSENEEFIGHQNKNKTRKKIRKPEKYKGNTGKRLRNSGQRYINKSDNVSEQKQFSKNPCDRKDNCHEKVSEEQRQFMFQTFWRIRDFKRQNAYLCGSLQKQEIKQRRPRKEGGVLRSGSNKYYLKLKNGVSVAVCKKYFLQTFSLSDGRVSRALKKVYEGKSPGEDLRGARDCPSRKISSSDTEFVCDHIKSFPAYQSHYTMKHNENRKYLCESLNLRKMCC